RLEHLLLIPQSSVRGETRVAQEFAVSGLRRRDNRVGEELRFPAQAVMEGEIRADLPFVLSKHGIIIVGDVRSARRWHPTQTAWNAVLQVKEERPARWRSAGRTVGGRSHEATV